MRGGYLRESNTEGEDVEGEWKGAKGEEGVSGGETSLLSPEMER